MPWAEGAGEDGRRWRLGLEEGRQGPGCSMPCPLVWVVVSGQYRQERWAVGQASGPECPDAASAQGLTDPVLLTTGAFRSTPESVPTLGSHATFLGTACSLQEKKDGGCA